MKEKPLIDLGMTGYDELFMNDKERKESSLPKIYDIPLREIDDFPEHPFKVRMDEDMDQLMESIHNHFVVNTVSFVDGIKYHRTKEDYLRMRDASVRAFLREQRTPFGRRG